MADDAVARYGIQIDGNPREFSREASAALEELRGSFKGAEDRSRELQASLRGLSGKSAEVTAAKSRLKAALDVEKTKMNEASLAIIKQGSAIGILTAKAKAGNKETDGIGKVVKGIGGPLQDAREKWDALKETLSGASVAEVGFATGAAVAAVAVVALTAAVVAGGIAFAKWVILGADAARSMQLLREGAVLASGNAANLGKQVDALSRKVPIAKAEINSMATDIYRAFNHTAASGAVIVDVMNIVGQSTAAAGGQVARTLQDIVERGKRVGRFQLNPFELQSTGLKFEDVAGELAKQLGVGVKQAQLALFQGRVTLDAGAHALAAAVNARFAELNARKLLSLDSLVMKFHESLQDLTSGVRLEPLGRAIKGIFDAFDKSTASGAALKAIVETLGNGLVKVLVAGLPLVRGFFTGFGIGLLDIGIAAIKTALIIKKTFGLDGPSSFLTFENAVTAGKVATYGIAAALGLAAVSLAVAVAPLALLVAGLYGLWKAAELVAEGIEVVGDGMGDLATMAVGWGGSVVAGIVTGVKMKWTEAKDAIAGLASELSSTFKAALGISSPSKVFADHGADVVAGLAGGLDAGRGSVQASANALAPSPPSFGGRGSAGGTPGGGNGPITLQVIIQAPGATADTVQKMTEAPFLAQLTHAIEHLLQASGVLTQAAPT